MNVFLAASVSLLTMIASSAWAQSPSISDADFTTKASVGNTFEIEESKLAIERATDQRIKNFAQKMIADHNDAERKLEAAAGKSGTQAIMMLDKPHQAMLDNLKTFNGTDFDKIYVADQVAAHAETVALVADYKQNGHNADLKSWANDALLVVKMHQVAINAM